MFIINLSKIQVKEGTDSLPSSTRARLSSLDFLNYKVNFKDDRAEKNDLNSRFLLFIYPFLLPHFFRREEEKNNQSCDFKSCLSARYLRYIMSLIINHIINPFY